MFDHFDSTVTCEEFYSYGPEYEAWSENLWADSEMEMDGDTLADSIERGEEPYDPTDNPF